MSRGRTSEAVGGLPENLEKALRANAAGEPLLKPGLAPLYYTHDSDIKLLEFLKAHYNEEVHKRFTAAAAFLKDYKGPIIKSPTRGALVDPAERALDSGKLALEVNQRFRAWLTVTAKGLDTALVTPYDNSTPAFWNTIGDYLAILLENYKDKEVSKTAYAAAEAKEKAAAANKDKKQTAIVSYTARLANGQRLYRILDNPKGRPSYFNYPTATRSTFRAKIASRENTYGQPYTKFEAAFGPDSVPLTRAQLDAMNTEKIAALAKDISALPNMLFTGNLKARNPRLARAVNTRKNSEGKNIIPTRGGARHRKTRRKARKSRRTH